MLRTALRTAAIAVPALAAASWMTGSVNAAGESAASVPIVPAPALDPNNFKPFKLQKIEKLSHDTNKYIFEMGASQDLGMVAAGLLLVKADINGKTVVRPYTPTSPVRQQGSFDLIVKAYPEGNISKWMAGLKEGDSVDMKGPLTKFVYQPNTWRAVGMIAGGSGITPMYQLITEILNNPRDRTEIRLVYANRTPGDIILKKELDALEAAHPNFKVLYTVDNADGGKWTGATGHINADMITSFLPPPEAVAEGSTDVHYKVLVCGPPGMMKHISGEKKSPTDQGDLAGLLASLKYSKAQVFKY